MWYTVTGHPFHSNEMDLFLFSLWGGGVVCKGEGQIWRDEEMSEIGVHDVKFTKN